MLETDGEDEAENFHRRRGCSRELPPTDSEDEAENFHRGRGCTSENGNPSLEIFHRRLRTAAMLENEGEDESRLAMLDTDGEDEARLVMLETDGETNDDWRFWRLAAKMWRSWRRILLLQTCDAGEGGWR
ncbi:unnamed protein product [Linum trigynum]|uniref:Uncharacterized protein n=1 Tax=Linum trigynum TaxID=586398 RepID=A0AAV2EB65_9ROSI